MFSMPHQRLPTGTEPVLRGTVRQTWGLVERGKSMLSGSLRVSTLPLMAAISFSCMVERHWGTAFCAAVFADDRLVTLPMPAAPVLGPLQPYVGCRLKYSPS